MNLWLIVPAKPFNEGKSRLADTLLPSERAAVNQNLLTNLLNITTSANVFAGIIVISRSKQVLQYARTLGAVALLETDSTPDAHTDAPIDPSTSTHSKSHPPTCNHPCCASTVFIPPATQITSKSGANGSQIATPTQPHRKTSLPKEDKLNRALTQATQRAIALGADATLVLPIDLPLITVDDVHQLNKLGTQQQGAVITRSQDGGTNALLLRPPNVIDYAFGINSFDRHCESAIAAGYPYKILESPTLAFDLDGPEDWQLWQASEPDHILHTIGSMEP